MDSQKFTLLIVDDETYLLSTITRLLEQDFNILTTDSVPTAKAYFEQQSIDIILTDQKMPHCTGIQLLEWVREKSPQTLRLLMTGYAEFEDAVQAINRGQVYHYIHKPWRADDLQQILCNAADKVQLEREREQLITELRELNAKLEQRVKERTAELEETNRLLHKQMCKLEQLAQTDSLTGLHNRRAISDIAEKELSRFERYPTPFTLGIIDVDRFKDINTRYLLTGGDAVLKGLARVLSTSIRNTDSIGRLGGEEFMVVAPETTFEGAEKLAERIRANVENATIGYRDEIIKITISAGFVVAEPGTKIDFDTLHHFASEAMNEAKASGRNCIIVRTLDASAIEQQPTY